MEDINRSTLCARIVSVTIVAMALAFTGGCSAKKPIQIVNRQSQNQLTDWVTAVKGALSAAGSSAALDSVAGRNLAISYSEAAVLARYTAFRNILLAGRAADKTFFDILELGLTAAVPITNGARGKTILGSLATGFKGTNLSIERNFFNEQSTATILSAMDTCVLRTRALIADKAGVPIQDYTIYGGYSDLTRLYGCTTLAGALQELSESQAVAAKQEQQKTLIAPITQQRVAELGDLQIAFAASVAGDKKVALAFLREMKVLGLSESSSASEILAAYRGLAAVLAKPAEVERLIQAGRKVQLLTSQN
jgi:hypothetical protein